MSSVHKQKNRPAWFCAFTDSEGVRHFRSTGTLDKSQAKRICMAWEQASRLAGGGKLTLTKARKIIASTVSDIMETGGEVLPSSKVKDFFEKWLERKLLEAGGRTHERYKNVVDDLFKFLGSKVNRDIAALTSTDLVNFRDYCAKRLTPGSANFSIKVIRSALNQAKRDGLIDVNEAERVTLLKKPRGKKRRAFTEPEIRAVLAAADDEWRGMVLVGLYTGLRLGDVCSLTWGQIDLPAKTITITTEKTQNEMVVPVADPLLRCFQSMPSTDDPETPLFPAAFEAKARNPHGGPLSNQFYRILTKAGLAEKRDHKAHKAGRATKREAGNLGFHCLRHTITTWLKSSGASDSVARAVVGHESASVSQIYTHMPDDVKRAAVDKLPDVTAP